MHNTTTLPTHVTLQPLREFHVDQGQGRTVAVLFRVAVDHHRSPASQSHQASDNSQVEPGIGVRK